MAKKDKVYSVYEQVDQSVKSDIRMIVKIDGEVKEHEAVVTELKGKKKDYSERIINAIDDSCIDGIRYEDKLLYVQSSYGAMPSFKSVVEKALEDGRISKAIHSKLFDLYSEMSEDRTASRSVVVKAVK